MLGLIVGLGVATSGVYAQQSPSRLPVPQSDNDPTPMAPKVSPEGQKVTSQAGIGGTQSYARAGVLELGGSGSLTFSTGRKEFSLSPSIGWFFMNNWQISAMVSYSTTKVDGADAVNTFRLLAEPSFHVPFSNTLFGFIGLGAGIAHLSGSDVGMAIAPRVGIKTTVGRSGMLTVDLRNTFATNDLIETPRGTLITVDSAFSIGAGYTVLW